ncbi:hypothetical protein [Amycolatopsis sp. cmx-4-61]|uniref:hypothetical protein n=1 Tax=Amycolatopsis sp. cmx-4-61 TaxID=2790937 RepID=UPI00397A67F9
MADGTQEVYAEGEEGVRLSADDGPSEEVQYANLTEFLRAYPQSAGDADVLAGLMRGTGWPAAALWPELWSLKRQGVLSVDVIVGMIGRLWGPLPDLARVAAVGDPDEVGVRLVATFPAVWPSLARWAQADAASAARIGRIVAQLAETYPAAVGQVVAAMAIHPQGMLQVLDKAGLRQHPKLPEVLVAAIGAAPVADLGPALTAWAAADTGVLEAIGHALVATGDWRKGAEILLLFASGLPVQACTALWLAMWNRAQAPALGMTAIAGQTQPDWSGRMLVEAMGAGVAPDALIAGILHFNPEAVPAAVRVVLALAGSPERVAALISEPLEAAPHLGAAVIAAVEHAPAAMAPAIVALLAAGRRESAAAILSRVTPPQAATVLSSAKWQSGYFARLLPRLRAHNPEAFAQLVAGLTPTSLATAGLVLAEGAQWPQIAKLASDLGIDTGGALLVASIAAHDPMGGASILVALSGATGPDSARQLLVAAYQRFAAEMQAVADAMAASGDTPARALLVTTLSAMAPDLACTLFLGILSNATGRAAGDGAAVDAAAELLAAIHETDLPGACRLLRDTFHGRPEHGRRLCVGMIERGDVMTGALATIARTDETIAARIVSALVYDDPEGRLFQRLYAACDTILAPAVLDALALDIDSLAKLLAVLDSGDQATLVLTIMTGLPRELAADVLVQPALERRVAATGGRLLDDLLAHNGEVAEQILGSAISRSPAHAKFLISWLMAAGDASRWAMLLHILTPQILAGVLPHLTAKTLGPIIDRLKKIDDGLIVEALAIAETNGFAYAAARIITGLQSAEAAGFLVRLPETSARGILVELGYGRVVHNENFLTQLGNANPGLLAFIIPQTSAEKAATVMCMLRAESLQALPRDVVTETVRKLGGYSRQRLVRTIESAGLPELADHLRTIR